jgi:hypothetical protein
MIDKLPGSVGYKSFAYDVALLKEFVREESPRDNAASSMNSARQRRRGFKGGLGGSLRGSFRKIRRKKDARNVALDSSIHSQGSLRGRRGVNSSIAGSGNVFNEIKAGDLKNPRRMGSLHGSLNGRKTDPELLTTQSYRV